MMTRRESLRTLALSAGALLLAPRLSPLDPLAATADTTGTGAAPATPPAAAPTGPYTLPPLPYAYDALEPHLDAQTMQIHHDKHHAAYVANLNKAVVNQPDLAKQPVEQLLRGLATVPEAIRTAVRNQGGGHANHSMLWTSLRKDPKHTPNGELAAAVDAAFGSFTAFQDKFNAAALAVFGSGWAWLALDGKKLAIETSANQDSPLSAGRTPLLGIDVWEHAYYLKFQNRRVEYVTAFANVVDWDAISARYRDALKG